LQHNDQTTGVLSGQRLDLELEGSEGLMGEGQSVGELAELPRQHPGGNIVDRLHQPTDQVRA